LTDYDLFSAWWHDIPAPPWQPLFKCSDVDIIQERLDEDPLFERMRSEELEDDPAANLLTEATEEGQKVARNNGEASNTFPILFAMA
jgi:hypothetical protein